MSKTVSTIAGEFNLDRAKRLKKAYDKAVQENQEVFTLDGYEWFTYFAKYVLKYLQMQKLL